MKATSTSRICVTIVVALAGCAGANVVQRSQTIPAEWSRPSLIVVFPFAVDPSEVALDQSITQTTVSSVSGDNESAAQLALACLPSVLVNRALSSRTPMAGSIRRWLVPMGIQSPDRAR
jgi:hypothetical protein